MGRVSAYAAMAALTFVYLLLELAFNAKLIDVLGAPASSADIHGIEQWGRTISGAAVALAVCGLIVAYAPRIFQRFDRVYLAAFISCVLVAAIVIPAVYYIERYIVDHDVERATPAHRQAATHVSLVKAYLYEGQALEGFDIDPAFFDQPHGKVFFALFSRFYVNVISQEDGRRLIDELIHRLAFIHLLDRVGAHNMDEAYARTYVDLVEAVKSAYNTDYIEGQSRYIDAGSEISVRRSVDRAWEQYLRELSKFGYTPDRVPRSRRHQVRERAEDLLAMSLPRHWQPDDQALFEESYLKSYRAKVEEDWDRGICVAMRRLSGRFIWESECAGTIPPSLQAFDEFWNSSPIQEFVKESLGLEGRLGPVPYPWSEVEWAGQWWVPKLTEIKDHYRKRYDADQSEFDLDGANFCIGEASVFALEIPNFALNLSMAGIIYHSSKLIYYVLVLTWPASFLGRYVLGHLFVFVFFSVGTFNGVMHVSNDVTSFEGYQRLSEYWGRAYGEPDAQMAEFIIKAQSLVYPVADYVRIRVWGGPEFEPFAETHECGI